MAEQAFHEAAGIFPIDEEHLDALGEDIQRNGLRVPIEMLDGKVLDGRRRWLACLKLGIKPTTENIQVADPVAYVLSLNLHRRHLSDAQLSMVAARAREFYDRAAKERMAEGGRHKAKENLPYPEAGQARDAAGKAVGVSGKSVDFATKVLRQGVPELAAAVDRDELPVSVAAKLAELPRAAQVEVLTGGKDAARQAVAPSVDEVVWKAFRTLSDRVDSIWEQFGSADKMLASKHWRDPYIGLFAGVVEELSKNLLRLHKEVQSYVNTHKAELQQGNGHRSGKRAGCAPRR